MVVLVRSGICMGELIKKKKCFETSIKKPKKREKEKRK
jgi:hypothetical protein